MDLKDFIAIKGKSELFRILAKTPKGLIVESLNETRLKFKVQPSLSVLLLNDITIFSNDNTDLYLKQVLVNFYKKDGLKISLDVKDEAYKLRDYFKEVVTNHDEEKVYVSDIKKIVKWYSILAEYYPEVLENLEKEMEEEAKAADSQQSTVDGPQSTDNSQQSTVDGPQSTVDGPPSIDEGKAEAEGEEEKDAKSLD
jgi:hypothetical protein